MVYAPRRTDMTRPVAFPSAQRQTAAAPNLRGSAPLARPSAGALPQPGQIARPSNARPSPTMSPGAPGIGTPATATSAPLPSSGGASMSASAGQSPPSTAGSSAGGYARGGSVRARKKVQSFAAGGAANPGWGSSAADPSTNPGWGSNGADFVSGGGNAASLSNPGWGNTPSAASSASGTDWGDGAIGGLRPPVQAGTLNGDPFDPNGGTWVNGRMANLGGAYGNGASQFVVDTDNSNATPNTIYSSGANGLKQFGNPTNALEYSEGIPTFAGGGVVPNAPGAGAAGASAPDFNGALAKVKAALQFGRQKSGLLGSGGATSGRPAMGYAGGGTTIPEGGIYTGASEAGADNNLLTTGGGGSGGGGMTLPSSGSGSAANGSYAPGSSSGVLMTGGGGSGGGGMGIGAYADGGAIDPTGGGDMDNPMNAGPGSVPSAPSPQGSGQTSSPVGYAMGTDAVPPDQAQALEASIDPHQQMDPSARKLLAAAAPSDQATQWGMIQAQRQKFNSYRAFAQAAMKGAGNKPPDLAAATHAATQAYQNVPDGNSVTFQPHPSGTVAVRITKLATGPAQQSQQQPQKGYDDGGIVDNDSDNDATTPPINGGNPPLPTPAPMAQDAGPPTTSEQSGVIPSSPQASPQDDTADQDEMNASPLSPSNIASVGGKFLSGANQAARSLLKFMIVPQFVQYLHGNPGSFDNSIDTGSDKVIQSLPDLVNKVNKDTGANFSVGTNNPSAVSNQLNNPRGIPSGANAQVPGSSAPSAGTTATSGASGNDSNLPLLHLSPNGQGNTLDLRVKPQGAKYNSNVQGGDSGDTMAAKMAATLGQGASLGGAAAGQFDRIPASAGGGPANRQQDTAGIDPAIIRQAKFLFPRMDQAQQARNYIAARMGAQSEQQNKLDVAKNTRLYGSQAIETGRTNAANAAAQARVTASQNYADARKYDAQMKASVAKDPASAAKWNVIRGAITSAQTAGTPMTDDQVQKLMGRIGLNAAPSAAPAAPGSQGDANPVVVFSKGPFANIPVRKGPDGNYQPAS